MVADFLYPVVGYVGDEDAAPARRLHIDVVDADAVTDDSL
jgi:hypothetical protein